MRLPHIDLIGGREAAKYIGLAKTKLRQLEHSLREYGKKSAERIYHIGADVLIQIVAYNDRQGMITIKAGAAPSIPVDTRAIALQGGSHTSAKMAFFDAVVGDTVAGVNTSAILSNSSAFFYPSIPSTVTNQLVVRALSSGLSQQISQFAMRAYSSDTPNLSGTLDAQFRIADTNLAPAFAQIGYASEVVLYSAVSYAGDSVVFIPYAINLWSLLVGVSKTLLPHTWPEHDLVSFTEQSRGSTISVTPPNSGKTFTVTLPVWSDNIQAVSALDADGYFLYYRNLVNVVELTPGVISGSIEYIPIQNSTRIRWLGTDEYDATSIDALIAAHADYDATLPISKEVVVDALSGVFLRATQKDTTQITTSRVVFSEQPTDPTYPFEISIDTVTTKVGVQFAKQIGYTQGVGFYLGADVATIINSVGQETQTLQKSRSAFASGGPPASDTETSYGSSAYQIRRDVYLDGGFVPLGVTAVSYDKGGGQYATESGSWISQPYSLPFGYGASDPPVLSTLDGELLSLVVGNYLTSVGMLWVLEIEGSKTAIYLDVVRIATLDGWGVMVGVARQGANTNNHLPLLLGGTPTVLEGAPYASTVWTQNYFGPPDTISGGGTAVHDALTHSVPGIFPRGTSDYHSNVVTTFGPLSTADAFLTTNIDSLWDFSSTGLPYPKNTGGDWSGVSVVYPNLVGAKDGVAIFYTTNKTTFDAAYNIYKDDPTAAHQNSLSGHYEVILNNFLSIEAIEDFLFRASGAFVMIDPPVVLPVKPPSIQQKTDNTASKNSTYNPFITAVGDAPIIWRLLQGAPGMSISEDAGRIWGGTGALGTYLITVSATNPVGSDTMNWALTVT